MVTLSRCLLLGRLFGALPSAQCAETGTSEKPVVFTISNTEPRRTVDGEILDAHDGCLEFFSGQYYLYGTRYGNTNGLGKTNRYVCYSSPDLVHWTYRGELLPDAPNRTYFRPYVKYNQATRKYVLWYNADNGYGVAVADAPEGPYKIQNPRVRLKHSDLGVGDFGLLVDEDGTAYIAYTCVLGGHFEVNEEPIPHHKIAIEKLTPDYLASTIVGSDFVAGNCESPAMSSVGPYTICSLIILAASALMVPALVFTRRNILSAPLPTGAISMSKQIIYAIFPLPGPSRGRDVPTASSEPSKPISPRYRRLPAPYSSGWEIAGIRLPTRSKATISSTGAAPFSLKRTG